MSRRRRYATRPAIAGMTLMLALSAACTGVDEAGPGSGASSAPTEGEAADQRPSAGDPAREELAVVSHATRPQLHLSGRLVERLGSGRARTWRGMRVVVGLRGPAVERAIRAVHEDPRTIAVVPLEAVGPTVVAATVDGVDPVRTHADAVAVTITGDLMLVRNVPDAEAALKPMRSMLRDADLTIGNLESTLSTDGTPTQGSDSFGGDPSLVGVLRRAGFDAVSLANNHAGDYGPRALVRTVDLLHRGTVVPFGAGPTLRHALRPAILRAGGTRIAFLGFNAIGETPAATATTPGALSVRMPPRTGPLDPTDLARVTRAIRRAERNADAVVVLPHWGEQYTHRPVPSQPRVARALVAAGADLVVGGHPHWVQGMEAVDGVPVLHSLGNFVFDMGWEPQTLEGVVLETTWWGGDLKAIRLVPYAMDAETFTPRVVSGPRAEDILGDIRGTSTGPYAGR